MEKKLIDIQELAKYLDSSVAFVRKLILTKQVPYFKVGGRIKFDRNEIDAWLECKKVEERKSIILI